MRFCIYETKSSRTSARPCCQIDDSSCKCISHCEILNKFDTQKRSDYHQIEIPDCHDNNVGFALHRGLPPAAKETDASNPSTSSPAADEEIQFDDLQPIDIASFKAAPVITPAEFNLSCTKKDGSKWKIA